MFIENTRTALSLVPQVGPLSPMRLAVKDLFHIAGIPTSAGNPDWLKTHPIPSHTHSSILKLVAAGADYVGKTITDELAYSLHGQNIHYGTPINAASPNRIPGGSSSGSVAAVAHHMAEIGLGTDTGGSIRVPASYNGVYGFRPSHNLIPCDNMVPLAPKFDTVAWMTRSLTQMRQVAEVLLVDKEPKKAKKAPKFALLEPFVKLAEHEFLIKEWLYQNDIDFDRIFTIDPKSSELNLAEAFRVLQGQQIIEQHGHWLQSTQAHIASDIAKRLEDCKNISKTQLVQASKVQQTLKTKVAVLFKHYDYLLVPSTPGIAPLLNSSPESLAEYRQSLLSMTALAGLVGLPQLHLPLFTYKDAPCGLSIIGNANSDLALLDTAWELVGTQYDYE